MQEADSFDLGFPIHFSSTIFEEHPSEQRYYNSVVGSQEEDERGLLHWMAYLIRDQLPDDWDGMIKIGTYASSEIVRKGVFPFIQIHPVPSSFEGMATCMDEHNVTVHIITSIRSGDLSYSYFTAVKYASDLYDLFKSHIPDDDYNSFEETPYGGRLEFDYREGQNQFIAFSLLELNYRFNISTEAKNE